MLRGNEKCECSWRVHPVLDPSSLELLVHYAAIPDLARSEGLSLVKEDFAGGIRGSPMVLDRGTELQCKNGNNGSGHLQRDVTRNQGATRGWRHGSSWGKTAGRAGFGRLPPGLRGPGRSSDSCFLSIHLLPSLGVAPDAGESVRLADNPDRDGRPAPFVALLLDNPERTSEAAVASTHGSRDIRIRHAPHVLAEETIYLARLLESVISACEFGHDVVRLRIQDWGQSLKTAVEESRSWRLDHLEAATS